MNSTIKIDYERSLENNPVIKIIQRPSLDEFESQDIRDKLISDFLHHPLQEERNYLFELATYYDINPNGNVSTIQPIPEDRLFERFKYALIERFVPYNTRVSLIAEGEAKGKDPLDGRECLSGETALIKINEFFNWISNEPYCEKEEHPKK